jgi:ABC-type sugar transport system ATPase subunit
VNVEPLAGVLSASKYYPGVAALQDVSFDIHAGEVHALVGENGAGKSTLVKALGGATRLDEGEIRVDAKQVRFRSPRDAVSWGIGVVYQELAGMPHLTVTENVLLGRFPTRLGKIRWPEAHEQARTVLEQLQVDIDVRAPLGRLRLGQQQIVEIARALAEEAKVLVFDEPSAILGYKEIEILFGVIRTLKEQGVGCVYVSHRLPEIFELADRVTVLKDGRLVGTYEASELDEENLVALMTGRELTMPERSHRDGAAREPLLAVKELGRAGVFEDVTFEVQPGEIVGMAGLVGSGRSEVARAICGMEPLDHGEIKVRGTTVTIKSPRDSRRLGIGLLPESRKDDGLLMNRSVRENIGLSSLGNRSILGVIKGSEDLRNVRELMRQLDVRAQSPDQLVMNLSGGNQQKVLLGRYLAADTEILILDEPTRGVDVGAKSEIYELMRDLADRGVAILMISSEIDEVVAMSDHVLVMREGRLVADLGPGEIEEDRIMRAALMEGAGKES